MTRSVLFLDFFETDRRIGDVMKDIKLSTAMRPKCARCGHHFGDHTANSRRCPIGRKHRTLGFTQYHDKQAYLDATEEQGRSEAEYAPSIPQEGGRP